MEIDLWSIDISQNAKKIKENPSLNDVEIAKAHSFKFPSLGEIWAFTRQALRDILSQYLSIPADSIKFEIEERGKLWVRGKSPDKNIFFNLSHSGSKALVAVTSICEIGVDIEKQKILAELDDIAKRFFSHSEYETLLALPNLQRKAAFFRIWTRKEALIKANGLGMSMPLDKFNVPVADIDDWMQLEILDSCAKNGHYYLYDVMINSEYDAALCLYSGDVKLKGRPRLRCFNFQTNDFG